MEQKQLSEGSGTRTLGWYEEREVATGKYKFTEEGKVAVVSEYVLGGRPAQEIVEKYHLSSRQVLFSWMDKYVNEREIVSLPENEEIWQRRLPKSACRSWRPRTNGFAKPLNWRNYVPRPIVQ